MPSPAKISENPDLAACRFTENMRRSECSFETVWLNGRSLRIQQERRSAFSFV